MPGNRSSSFGDSVTSRALYRGAIAAADADDPTNAAIPVLDTRTTDPNYGDTGVASNYGRNAQINIASYFSTGTPTATLKIYMLASIDILPNSDLTVRWVLATPAIVLAASSHNVIKDLPPGQYKILVTTLGAGAHLDLLTQYAA